MESKGWERAAPGERGDEWPAGTHWKGELTLASRRLDEAERNIAAAKPARVDRLDWRTEGGAMKRLTALASVGALAVFGLVAGTRPAEAKAPGPNGQIAFQ